MGPGEKEIFAELVDDILKEYSFMQKTSDPVWFDPTEENLKMELAADQFEKQKEVNPDAGTW